MVLREMGILWNQGKGRMEGQTIRKEAAKEGRRFTHLRFHDLKAYFVA